MLLIPDRLVIQHVRERATIPCDPCCSTALCMNRCGRADSRLLRSPENIRPCQTMQDFMSLPAAAARQDELQHEGWHKDQTMYRWGPQQALKAGSQTRLMPTVSSARLWALCPTLCPQAVRESLTCMDAFSCTQTLGYFGKQQSTAVVCSNVASAHEKPVVSMPGLLSLC